MMTIGVLAIQGSYARHLEALEALGVGAREVRKPTDLEGLAGLILPGGESTTQWRLAAESGLYQAIGARGRENLALFGTCAGAILLGQGETDGDPPRLGICPVTLERNAYGRQRESFCEDCPIEPFAEPFPCVFIRAPKIRRVGPGAEVLARAGDDPILVRVGRHLLATFHPELTDDRRVHVLWLEGIRD